MPPVRVNLKPREIPGRLPHVRSAVRLVLGGILPFGCIFIQLFFILNSIWLDFSALFAFIFNGNILASKKYLLLPSVLWRCWLGGRKGIRPVKTEWWGTGVVICLERGADLHMAQLMPLPLTVCCFSKIQIGFTFLVLAYPGCPGKEAVKWL